MTTPTQMPESLKVVPMRMTPGIFAGHLTMFPSEDGQYCRLSDFEAALQSALKNRDAEIERLKKDAERYRWLRDEANDTPARAPMAVMVDGEFSVTWRDALYGSGLDAAIDSMKGDANG